MEGGALRRQVVLNMRAVLRGLLLHSWSPAVSLQLPIRARQVSEQALATMQFVPIQARPHRKVLNGRHRP